MYKGHLIGIKMRGKKINHMIDENSDEGVYYGCQVGQSPETSNLDEIRACPHN